MNLGFFEILAGAIVVFAVLPVHEFAHGYAAYKLGDDTARREGRLTLNPLVHLDLIGSILIILTGFGWAKPVQVNPRNFKNPRRDMAITSLAGPMANIVLSLIFMIILKLLIRFGIGYSLFGLAGSSGFYYLISYIISINLYLAVFNLLPVPPLDGFKIFGSLFPDKIYFTILQYERYISLILFVLIFSGLLRRPIIFLANFVYLFLDTITNFIL